MVYKVFDKKNSGSSIKNENILKKDKLNNCTNQLLENLIKEK